MTHQAIHTTPIVVRPVRFTQDVDALRARLAGAGYLDATIWDEAYADGQSVQVHEAPSAP